MAGTDAPLLFTLGDYTVRLARDPLRSLDSATIASLRAGLVPVARAAFGTDAITESDVELHALDVTHGIFVQRGDVHAAFSSGTPAPTSLGLAGYMQGTAIHPDFKRLGLYHLLIALRLLMLRVQRPELAFVATRTQSPVVCRRFADFQPYPLYRRDDSPSATVATELAEKIFADFTDYRHPDGFVFERPTGVFRHAYPGSMYGSIPWSGDPELDAKCRAALNFDDGDAFVLAAPFDLEVTRRLLLAGLDRLDTTPDQRATVLRWATVD